MWLELLFWISIFLIFYTYLIYPIVLLIVSSFHQLRHDFVFLFSRSERRVSCHKNELPSVAVVIAAYNEERDIEERVKNLLQQDYPVEKLSIYVGSDGSQDKTVAILNSFTDKRVNIFAFEQNRGKISVLNDLVSRIQDATVLVFSDANTHFDRDVISRLVCHFKDEKTGAVCGELNLVDGASKQNSDGLYWRYERLLKFHEGRIGGLLGANGANYAIRRNLYNPLPENTIVDDFTIVMDIAIQGYTVKYEPEAVAVEEIAPDVNAEFARRVRIGTGNYLALSYFSKFLWPKFSSLYFCYISHKVCRWFVPHFMLVALVSNLFLIKQPFYVVLFSIQVSFYLTYFLINKIKGVVNFSNFILFPLFILLMNLALAIGFFRFFTGNAKGSWSRTER